MGPVAAIFLQKFAEVLAAEAGTRISAAIAKRVTDVLFGHLATKEDIQRAVEEIKQHIDQKFDELTVASIVVPFLDAKANFDIWTQNQDEDYLTYASQRAITAISSFKESRSRYPALGRQNFVALAGILALDLGIWFHKTAINERNEPVLVARCLQHANLLEDVIGDIEKFESLSIVNAWEDSTSEDYPSPGKEVKLAPHDRHEWRVVWFFIGYVLLNSQRKGDELISTGWKNMHEYVGKFEALKSSAQSRIAAEHDDRERNLYAPAREAIKAMRASSHATVQRHMSIMALRDDATA